MAVFFSRFPRTAREGHEVLEATEARQGRWGRHVFWVLVASTVLAVLALFGSWAFHAGDLQAASEASTPTVAEAAATTGPETNIRQ
jgi:hypothetical protein